jgi:lipopolysaccharide transport system permease protein
MSFASKFPEWVRIRDMYFWMTAFIIAKNNIVREYQNSFLGVVWTVLLPLIQVVIFVIIMPMIMSRSIENYPLYLVASFPLWAFISGGLVQSCNAILNQAETIKRCMVSSVVFPIADIMKHFYNYIISFLTMYAFCLVFYVDFDPVVLLLPLFLLPLLITMLAMSITISYIAPYVRDVGYLMHMVVTIMFWFTPVVYPMSVVPADKQWLFWLNPFYILMQPVQQLIFLHQLPTFTDIFANAIVMAISVIGGFFVYRACRSNYVYYL